MNTNREQVTDHLAGHLAGLTDAELTSLTGWAIQTSRSCDKDGQHRLRGTLVALAGLFEYELEAREQARAELAAMGFEL